MGEAAGCLLKRGHTAGPTVGGGLQAGRSAAAAATLKAPHPPLRQQRGGTWGDIAVSASSAWCKREKPPGARRPHARRTSRPPAGARPLPRTCREPARQQVSAEAQVSQGRTAAAAMLENRLPALARRDLLHPVFFFCAPRRGGAARQPRRRRRRPPAQRSGGRSSRSCRPLRGRRCARRTSSARGSLWTACGRAWSEGRAPPAMRHCAAHFQDAPPPSGSR